MRVIGDRRWSQVSAGAGQTCGVTTENRPYCWGNNPDGRLGDGTTTRRLQPTAVAGGLFFRQIDAGFQHTCAVRTPGDRAYCWGSNDNGALGDGTTLAD